MGDIFLKLLHMSITAGWLILLVAALRFLLKKAPRWIICLFWAMVAVRLVCPVSIESGISMVPRTELVRSSTVINGKERQVEFSTGIDFIAAPGAKEAAGKETPSGNEVDRGISLPAVLQACSVVWLSGMAFFWLFALASRVKIHRMLQEAVCWRDNISVSDRVRSPFILGILRPRIFLPSGLEEGQEAYILAHEEAHLRRRDHWWKPFGYLLLSVYWFQPLCWAAYILFCRDIELACDEKVIRDLSFPERKAYSRVLLECGKQRKMILSCPLAFGEVSIRERVKAVLNYKKPAFWLAAVAAAACVILAVLFLTNRREEAYIVTTYQETRAEDVEEYLDQGLACIHTTYYEMSDGTWKTDEHTYRYCLEVSGTLNQAARNTTYRILSNDKDITFEQAWKASGLSSSMADYFEPGETEIVATILSGPVEAAGQPGAGGPEGAIGQPGTGGPEGAVEPEGSGGPEGSEGHTGVLLHEEPIADQVCIQVQPSEYRERLTYYYIPQGADQEWLQNRVKDLKPERQSGERVWQGHKEKGWSLVYNDMCLTAFEGGYLFGYETDEEGMYEVLTEDPKLCDYIQILLQQELNYVSFDPADIRELVSAKLETAAMFTDHEFYSQTITDPKRLGKLEEWLGNAEYIYGGADCGNERACLELILAGGETVKLSMATDSCANFGINGVYYDYRQGDGWYNIEFYRLFDEIPWEE